MAYIDIDALRNYMEDEYGAAMMNGFTAAILDLADIDSMNEEELCRCAEDQGVGLRKFEAS